MYNHLLDTFIAVADTGSFSAAARILFVSPTAVIKKINHLEYEYGITLLKRTHYGVELTEEGKALSALTVAYNLPMRENPFIRMPNTSETIQT